MSEKHKTVENPSSAPEMCVFFYGACRDDKLHKGCLSQWQKCEFSVDGIKYVSAEQYMMAEKARVFHDEDALREILAAGAPRKIKELGRKVQGFDPSRWDEVKFDIVCRGNKAKFSQNRNMLAFLLGTGDAMLVEASPNDTVWGIGLKDGTRDILDPGKWRGENLLGKALMKVRAELAEEKEEELRKDDTLRENFQAGKDSAVNIVALRYYNVRKDTADLRAPAKRTGKRGENEKTINRLGAGLPGATRVSMITGLMADPTDRKWTLFLRDGPYWNYLTSYIRRKNVFKGREDRVEEAVQNTCAKIGKFMCLKRYKYPEPGKGYFRGFLKTVAFRTALDLLKDIRRQESIKGCGNDEKVCDSDEIPEDMIKAGSGKSRAGKTPDNGLETEIAPCSDYDLDVYDASAGFERRIAKDSPRPKRDKSRRTLLSLEELFFTDVEMPSGYSPADFFDYVRQVSTQDMEWVARLQLHVLYISLGYVLTDERVSADQREMLRLRYGQDMSLEDIYALPRFSDRKRSALDVTMHRAVQRLKKEVKTWWEIAAPDNNDFADESVMRFWRDLSGKKGRSRLANDLQDKAIEIAGRIE